MPGYLPQSRIDAVAKLDGQRRSRHHPPQPCRWRNKWALTQLAAFAEKRRRVNIKAQTRHLLKSACGIVAYTKPRRVHARGAAARPKECR